MPALEIPSSEHWSLLDIFPSVHVFLQFATFLVALLGEPQTGHATYQ